MRVHDSHGSGHSCLSSQPDDANHFVRVVSVPQADRSFSFRVYDVKSVSSLFKVQWGDAKET